MRVLTTHYTAEQPLVVLLGENTSFKRKITDLLLKKDISVSSFSLSEVYERKTDISRAYKVIWLQTTQSVQQEKQEQLQYAQYVAEICSHFICIIPVISVVSPTALPEIQDWISATHKQKEWINLCNLNLSQASFIFGENVLFEPTLWETTSLKYIVDRLQKKTLYVPRQDISLITEKDFSVACEQLLFIPQKQISYLISGQKYSSAGFFEKIQRLYEIYHSVHIETKNIFEEKTELIPFAVQSKQITTEYSSVITQLIAQLPTPILESENKSQLPQPQLSQRQQTNIIPPFQEQDKEEKATFKPQEKEQIDAPSEQLVIQETESEYNTPTRSVPQKEYQLKEKLNALSVQQSTVANTISENIQKNPNIYINTAVVADIEKQNKVKSEPEPLLTDMDFSQEITRIFKDERVEEKVERVVSTVKKTKKVVVKSKNKRVLFSLGIFSIIVSTVVLGLAAFFFITQSFFKQQLLAVISQEREYVNPTLTKIVTLQAKEYSALFDSSFLITTELMGQLAIYIQTTPEFVVQAREAAENLVLQILTGNFGETTELAQKSVDKGLIAYEKLSQAQALMKQIEFSVNSEKQEKLINQYEAKLQSVRSSLSLAQQLQQVIPTMVGIEGKRTYAVLLQNDQELRPTGGFIQAVALLNFDAGSLVSYQVYSVYELDRKITGEISPPEEIKRYLGEEKWYLRDSNWSPDFPYTAKQVAWFIDNTLNVQIDGVLAVTVLGLADILEAMGPVDLPNFNEVLTHKNIAERMEFHSEIILVDSVDKIDYSKDVLSQILKELVQIEKKQALPLAEALQKTLETRQMQLSVFNENEQEMLQTLGWTGALPRPNCPTRLSSVPCTIDAFTAVEANIGVNKANQYISRDTEHSVTLTTTEAQHNRKTTFTNSVTTAAWPKGAYKSYQRFYLPKNARLNAIVVNGKQLSEPEITRSVFNDFTVIGAQITIPIQETIPVELRYSTPIDLRSSFSYVFYNQKQSGISENDAFSVRLSYPTGMNPVLIAPNATVSGNTITFTAKNIDEASLFGVQFE